MVSIEWEHIGGGMTRAMVPGGWLVTAKGAHLVGEGMTFVPDPNHSWN